MVSAEDSGCPKCGNAEWDTSAYVNAICAACGRGKHLGDPAYGSEPETGTCLCGQAMNSGTMEGVKDYRAMATCGDCGHYD
jgi:hypothetical protein